MLIFKKLRLLTKCKQNQIPQFQVILGRQVKNEEEHACLSQILKRVK